MNATELFFNNTLPVANTTLTQVRNKEAYEAFKGNTIWINFGGNGAVNQPVHIEGNQWTFTNTRCNGTLTVTYDATTQSLFFNGQVNGLEAHGFLALVNVKKFKGVFSPVMYTLELCGTIAIGGRALNWGTYRMPNQEFQNPR